MMSIIGTVDWEGCQTLKEIETLSVIPLMELSSALGEIERIDITNIDRVHAINQAIYDGLCNLQASMAEMVKNMEATTQGS